MKNKIINITRENIWKYYPKSFSQITPSIQKELLNEVSKFGKGNILDAGTGVGKLIPYLLGKKEIKIIFAVDFEKEMLKEVKRKNKNLLKSNKIKIYRSDVTNLPFQNQIFDSIFSLNVLYTLLNPIDFLYESFRVLKPEGNLILSGPNLNLPNKKSQLEKIIEEEFKTNPKFEIFKKCNRFLISNFKPKLYSNKSLCEILKNIGFKIIKSDNENYLGANYKILAKKN